MSRVGKQRSVPETTSEPRTEPPASEAINADMCFAVNEAAPTIDAATDAAHTEPGPTADDSPPSPPATGVAGRSPAQLTWVRLRRDRTAVVSGIVLAGLLVIALAAPLIEWAYGVRNNPRVPLRGCGSRWVLCELGLRVLRTSDADAAC